MRVLILANGLDIGGAETYVYNLSIGLNEHGIQPIVVSSGGVYASKLEEHNIQHINAPLFEKNIKSLIKSYRIIVDILKEKDIDIIHAHARIPALICHFIAMRYKKPFIVTAHAKFRYSLILKLTSVWGDRTICISDDLKNYLITRFKVRENKINIIENAIDLELFKKYENNITSEERRIVTVSRLDRYLGKTCKKIIEAVAKLDKKGKKITLNIIGDGEYYPILKKQIEQLRLKNSKINLLGIKTDIHKQLQGHHLAVCVSRAAMEAMACELPIILAGGEGYLGILTEKNFEKAKHSNLTGRGYMANLTTENLEKDIETVLFKMSEEQKKKMGEYNREIIMTNYSLHNMIEKSEQLYKEVMEAKI